MPTLQYNQSTMSSDRSVAKGHIFAKTCASWLPGGGDTLWAGTWNAKRSASGSCRRVQMFFHIFCPHKGLFIIIHPSFSHCWSHKFSHFKTAQLSVHRISGQGSYVITNRTALTLAYLATMVHSCSYPESVSGWLDNNCPPSR